MGVARQRKESFFINIMFSSSSATNIYNINNRNNTLADFSSPSAMSSLKPVA